MVVYVEPQLDRVGTGEEQTARTLSHTEGELGQTLGDAGQIRQSQTTQNNKGYFNQEDGSPNDFYTQGRAMCSGVGLVFWHHNVVHYL